MAKYTVTYPDGETETITLFGPIKERLRRIEYLERSGTSSKQREQEMKQADEKAKSDNAMAGLPPLKGSEKQIVWAEKIRADILNKLKNENGYKAYKAITANGKFEEAKKKAFADGVSEADFNKWNQPVFDMFIEADNRLRKENSASWWIDHRGDYFSGESIVSRLYPDIAKEYAEHTEKYKAWKSQPVQSKSTPENSEKIQPRARKNKVETKTENSSGYTMTGLQKIHDSRRPQSIAMDEMQSHAVTINPDSPKVKQWISDPGRADIRGIDSPRSSLSGRKKLRISPKSRRLPR